MSIVIIIGGGDIGTGVAHRLYRSGFEVIITEIESPLVIRRKVSFAQAVFDGETVVEEVRAVKALNREEVNIILNEGDIPVIIDPDCKILKEIDPDVLVDAKLAKKNTCMHKNLAPLTIALGPGFKAGEEVDLVIETKRGHNLGRIIFEGYAEPDTGIPESVEGYREERVLRAPSDGKILNILDIGDQVKKGETVCYVGEKEVKSSLDGVIRGIIMNGIEVKKGFKIGDIDPRGIKEYCYTISDKSRAVGGGVLEAILYMKKIKKV